MRYIVIIASVVILIGGFACREKVVTPDGTPQSVLTAEDVGVTDVWIKIALPPVFEQRSVTLKRDTLTILETTLFPTDTLITDEHLLPHHTYKYTLIQNLSLGLKRETSITITTMDTTSHNFTWEIDTLGDGNSSVLRDVAIINDTLAYAVGEIYKKDSTGQFESTMYNIAKWNGHEWKLERAYFYWQGQPYVTQLNSIFAFSENDMWIGTGGPYHWEGHTWTTYDMNGIFNGAVTKFWGTSSSNLYMVGANGSIVFFNGSNWRKMNSGTIMSFTDIYGSPDTIVIAGIDPTLMKGIVLRKSGSSLQTIAEGDLIFANEIFKPKLYGYLTSVWIDENNTIYAGGNLFYKYQFGKWNYVKSLPENYIGGNPNVYYRGFIYKIRGIKSNDLWIVGDRNTIRHFNGVSWQQIGLPYDPTSDIIWRSIDVKNNLCVAVGDGWNKAICIRIKR